MWSFLFRHTPAEIAWHKKKLSRYYFCCSCWCCCFVMFHFRFVANLSVSITIQVHPFKEKLSSNSQWRLYMRRDLSLQNYYSTKTAPDAYQKYNHRYYCYYYSFVCSWWWLTHSYLITQAMYFISYSEQFPTFYQEILIDFTIHEWKL